jgi:diguanylate cyclase (GGDEF)-like protein/PAS domain S-box-containing protein
MNKLIRTVLLVEDNRGDARLVREIFKEQGLHDVELTHTECMGDAEKHLAENAFDVILLDLGLPDAHGLEAVQRIIAAAPRSPLVVLSGMDDESMGVQALLEGAQDYLIKGQIEPRELLRSLRYAIARKKIEEELFAEKELAEVTLRCIGDAVICTDPSGRITFLNPIAETMTGSSLMEAVGKPMDKAFKILDAINRERAPNPMERISEHSPGNCSPWNCILVRPDRSEIHIQDSVSPIRDRQGNVMGTVAVLRDVSAARAMAKQIVHAAEHDFLTGLPNRTLLFDRLSQAVLLAKRHMHHVAVLFLDLDGFKHINDSLGHAIGDEVLRSVAKRLRTCMRMPDTVSRQGGDEFVVLLQEVKQQEDAAIAAVRILHALAEQHFIGGHEHLCVTASIGISIYPGDGLDAETLIKNADTAMYQAKENGRRNYQFYRPEMNIRAVERQSIEEHLRQALERNEFELHYQPQVNLRTRAITGVEALIRWNHPSRGMVPPMQFIPVAEDSGLILPIGAWVLHEACMQAQAWANAGLPRMTMDVNVSPVQFENENFLDDLFAILDETGLDPTSLELEVTEGILMKCPKSKVSTLKILRDKGVRVAIDDFGTGYSSLSYLRKFPLDALKIDQSFIRQLSTTPDETTMVSAIISIGRSLNLRLIAEGIETSEQLAFLQASQCDEGQGYLFGQPMAPWQFVNLFDTRSSLISA